MIKYWLDVGMEEQARRFQGCIDDPCKAWKLSPVDVESYKRRYRYSKVRDPMPEATDTGHAPWRVARSDSKKRAGLNCISHLLSRIPYDELLREQVDPGKPSRKGKYEDQAALRGRNFFTEPY